MVRPVLIPVPVNAAARQAIRHRLEHRQEKQKVASAARFSPITRNPLLFSTRQHGCLTLGDPSRRFASTQSDAPTSPVDLAFDVVQPQSIMSSGQSLVICHGLLSVFDHPVTFSVLNRSTSEVVSPS